MLFQILRVIALVAIRFFFRSIKIKGLEHIPRKSGFMVLANHPSTFLDPIVLAVWFNRPIYFLGNGGLFKGAFLKWLFQNLYVIPVYRQKDVANDSQEVNLVDKNKDSFAACYELLNRGGALMIFPEGGSENERRLRKIKTGAARIALGTAANVPILCAGINYTNPRQFQSKLLIQFDAPLQSANYKSQYATNENEAVRQLTADIADALGSLIVITESPEADEITHYIETLYGNEIKNKLNLASSPTEQVFEIAQRIADAVHFFEKHDKNRLNNFQQQAKQYFEALKNAQLSDMVVAKYASQSIDNQHDNFFKLFFGFPICLYGALHNFVPFRLPAWLTNTITKDITFKAPINLVGAILTFSVFYLLYGFVFWQFVPSFFALLLYVISLPVSGFVAFDWWQTWEIAAEKRHFLKCSQTVRDQLMTMRKTLTNDLADAEKEYAHALSLK